MNQIVDQYRVQLFKKKIREINSKEIEGIRFIKSAGGCHLVFETRRYVDEEKVADIFTKNLSRNGIDFIVKRNPFGLYSDRPVEKQPIWYISIPIDQEALPERKR